MNYERQPISMLVDHIALALEHGETISLPLQHEGRRFAGIMRGVYAADAHLILKIEEKGKEEQGLIHIKAGKSQVYLILAYISTFYHSQARLLFEAGQKGKQ